MKHHTILALALLLCCQPLGALAQSEPAQAAPNEFRRFEVFYAPLSYARHGDNNFSGGKLDFAFHLNPRVALVADLAGDFQQSTASFGAEMLTDDVEVWLYSFGPRLIFHRTDRVSIFGQALAGGSRLLLKSTAAQGATTITSSTHSDGFAFAAGGGLDVAWKRWLAFRIIQVDYSLVNIKHLRNGLHVGAGLSFRFGR